MKLVRATNQSRVRHVKIKELGRVVMPNEQFTVSDERFKVLSGNNKFRVPFVELVEDVSEDDMVETIIETPVESNDTTEPEIKAEAEEVPEIFVIEPGKDPVKVDENLKPIVEEEVVVEAPKKRGRKKKAVEELTEEEKVEAPAEKEKIEEAVEAVTVEEKPKKRTRKVKEVSE